MGSLGAQTVKNPPAMQETQGSNLEDPWRRKWQPTPVFLPAESDGQRSLEGCSPRGRPESDTTERLSQLLLRQVRPGRSSAPSPLTAPISPRVKDKDLTVFSVDAHTSTPLLPPLQPQSFLLHLMGEPVPWLFPPLDTPPPGVSSASSHLLHSCHLPKGCLLNSTPPQHAQHHQALLFPQHSNPSFSAVCFIN